MSKPMDKQTEEEIETDFLQMCASVRDRETADGYVKDYMWSPVARNYADNIPRHRMEELLTADAFAFRTMQCLDALAKSGDIKFYRGLRYGDPIWRWELCLRKQPNDPLIRNALNAHAGARTKNKEQPPHLRTLCDCAYNKMGDLQPPSRFVRKLEQARQAPKSSKNLFGRIIQDIEAMNLSAGRPEKTGTVPATLVREVYQSFCKSRGREQALELLRSRGFIEHVYDAAEFYGFSIYWRATEQAVRNFRSDEGKRLTRKIRL